MSLLECGLVLGAQRSDGSVAFVGLGILSALAQCDIDGNDNA